MYKFALNYVYMVAREISGSIHCPTVGRALSIMKIIHFKSAKTPHKSHNYKTIIFHRRYQTWAICWNCKGLI